MTELAPFIQTEIGKFNNEINEAELKELVVKYKDLRIADVHDKEGYNAVYEARQILKSKRIEITKKGKTLRESAVAFQKAVIARENELVNVIEPTEKILLSEEERIDQERERLKKEEEEKEAIRINSMIQKLTELNYAVDYNQLKNLNDDSFAELLAEAKKEFDLSQQKLKQQEAEARELKRQEEERMEAERQKIKEEQERIAKQQAEIRKQQEEITRQQIAAQKAITEEQERRDAEFRKALEEQQRKFKEEQARIYKENQAREAEIKAQQKVIEDEKRAIQEQKEAEERNRLQLIQEEADRKAAEEQAAKEEIERQNKINQEAEQKSKFVEDSQRFAFLAQQLEVSFINSSVWSKMLSERGKNTAYEVQSLIRNAHKICKENSVD